MNTTYQNDKWPSFIAITIFLILIVIANICAGCNPCKRLTKRCPIKDSVVYRETFSFDTVIEIIPGDTTYIEIPATTLEDLGILSENKNQKIELKVEKGKVKLRTICKEDSLKIVIAEMTRELSKDRTIIKEVKVKEIITRPGKFAKFCIWYAVITWLLVILFVAYKIFKPKIPLINS